MRSKLFSDGAFIPSFDTTNSQMRMGSICRRERDKVEGSKRTSIRSRHHQEKGHGWIVRKVSRVMSSGTTVTSLETSSQVTDYGRRREETNKVDMDG